MERKSLRYHLAPSNEKRTETSRWIWQNQQLPAFDPEKSCAHQMDNNVLRITWHLTSLDKKFCSQKRKCLLINSRCHDARSERQTDPSWFSLNFLSMLFYYYMKEHKKTRIEYLSILVMKKKCLKINIF